MTVVQRVLGHTYVCPTHNTLGGVKLIVATLDAQGQRRPEQRPRPRRRPRAPRHRGRGRPRPRRARVHRQRRPRALGRGARRPPVRHRRPALLRRRPAPGQPREPPRRPRGRPTRRGVRLVLDVLAHRRERVVRPAARAGPGRRGRSPTSCARWPRPRTSCCSTARRTRKCNDRRAPRHRQPGRPREVHERGRRLRGAAHLRRHGRAHDGGAGPRARGDVRRGRGAVGDAPDARPSREACVDGGRPDRGGLRRRLPQGRRLPPPRERPSRQHALAAALYQTSGIRALVTGLVGRDDLLPSRSRASP